MALETLEQIQKLLAEKKRILLTFPQGDGDSVGSALALANVLRQENKVVDIAMENFVLPTTYKFLDGSDTIKNQLTQLQQFIISLDVTDRGLSSLTYDVVNETLRIAITPKQGVLGRDRVRTTQSAFAYDLIIVLNSPDLSSLGAIYADNTELFLKTPIINIDHKPENDRFGHVHHIDITATTTAELVYEVVKTIAPERITKEVATALLTAIVAKTRSFKNEATHPRLLSLASTLIGLGADRDAIVRHLFRTRTIVALKLWGQALRHLEHDRSIGLVWSTITRDDFIRSGAKESDLHDVIDELIINSPEARVVVLLYETSHANTSAIHVVVKGERMYRLKHLLRQYNPLGHDGMVTLSILKKNLHEAEQEVTNFLKSKLQSI